MEVQLSFLLTLTSQFPFDDVDRVGMDWLGLGA